MHQFQIKTKSYGYFALAVGVVLAPAFVYADPQISLRNNGDACTAANEGAMYYNSSENQFYFCADSAIGWETLEDLTPATGSCNVINYELYKEDGTTKLGDVININGGTVTYWSADNTVESTSRTRGVTYTNVSERYSYHEYYNDTFQSCMGNAYYRGSALLTSGTSIKILSNGQFGKFQTNSDSAQVSPIAADAVPVDIGCRYDSSANTYTNLSSSVYVGYYTEAEAGTNTLTFKQAYHPCMTGDVTITSANKPTTLVSCVIKQVGGE